jgi:hypothetical protein
MQLPVIKVLSNVWCERITAHYQGTEIELWDVTIQSLTYPILVPKALMQEIEPDGQRADLTLLESHKQILILSVKSPNFSYHIPSIRDKQILK